MSGRSRMRLPSVASPMNGRAFPFGEKQSVRGVPEDKKTILHFVTTAGEQTAVLMRVNNVPLVGINPITSREVVNNVPKDMRRARWHNLCAKTAQKVALQRVSGGLNVKIAQRAGTKVWKNSQRVWFAPRVTHKMRPLNLRANNA